jgi:hypothetical protein
MPERTKETHKKYQAGWLMSWPRFELCTSQIQVWSVTDKPPCPCFSKFLCVSSIKVNKTCKLYTLYTGKIPRRIINEMIIEINSSCIINKL